MFSVFLYVFEEKEEILESSDLNDIFWENLENRIEKELSRAVELASFGAQMRNLWPRYRDWFGSSNDFSTL